MARIIAKEDYRRIRGKSTIDHQIRVKLSMSMSEYVIMLFLDSTKIGEDIPTDKLFVETGLTLTEFNMITNSLIDKKLVTENFLVPTSKWTNEFASEKDFEEFWEIFQKHGEKNQAKKNYFIVRKTVDKDYLHERARIYIKGVLEVRKSIDYGKGAQVWLNPKEERWNDLAPGENKVTITKEEEQPTTVYKGSFFEKKN